MVLEEVTDIEEANLVVHEGSVKEIVNKTTGEWHAAYKISILTD